MEYTPEKFRKKFPRLARELEEGAVKVSVDSVRSDVEAGERVASQGYEGYDPDVVDFLRRCDTEEEAEAIIDFVEKRGKISTEYAERLRRQLKAKGVRSFGSKKGSGYYLRQWRRESGSAPR